MLLRRPLEPLALGAARGSVVSAKYSYLVGTATPFARRFISAAHVHRQAQVGGFHLIHAEDARRVSPKWLQFTEKVRAFADEQPDAFATESMTLSEADASDPAMVTVRRRQGRWHSEMYGTVEPQHVLSSSLRACPPRGASAEPCTLRAAAAMLQATCLLPRRRAWRTLCARS